MKELWVTKAASLVMLLRIIQLAVSAMIEMDIALKTKSPRCRLILTPAKVTVNKTLPLGGFY